MITQELKNLIIEGYITSFNNLNKIISGKRPNFWIRTSKQYLTPSILCKPLPLKDETGEFKYYNKICETLEKLLAGEKAEHISYFNEAPDEIKNLLDKVHFK